ncbi:MAG: hypothetical protein J6S74_02035 [Alphaproteobacteria bacterium]|nr:hypothetical protein [Alphaproteobacteria bacterium]
MKKYISILGILAFFATPTFAEDESIMLDLDTVVEEVATGSIESITVEDNSDATEVVAGTTEPVQETVVEENAPETEPVTDNTEHTTHPEGDAEYITFMHQYEDGTNDQNVIVTGERGDFLTYINESEELLEMYNNREKTAMFLSIEDPVQYIQPGKCMVNTIPYSTRQEQDLTLGDCYLRLFCGAELPGEGNYAIELCGKIVQD